ncbi:MAG: DUF4041 domain-containing protein [Deltaproteobacteria bacterium]|nr:DUF4041 domain-containing protein [Deltaproteobacteria bacterium]
MDTILVAALAGCVVLILILSTWVSSLRKRLKPLDAIEDVDAYAEKTKRDAEHDASEERQRAHEEATRVLAEAQKRAETIEAKVGFLHQRIEQRLSEAENMAKRDAQQILTDADAQLDAAKRTLARAERQAEEIVGSARRELSQAKDKLEDIERRVAQADQADTAIRNKLNGYGDEYLIPNRTLIDDLADEYDHQQAGKEMKGLREEANHMIKNGTAGTCLYVEKQRQRTAVGFVTDAFNGKCASILARAKNDNFGTLEQELKDAFALVNRNGEAFRSARITDEYFALKQHELRLACTLHELRRQDNEEQRRFKEAMREEERSRREYEKAQKDAAKEEKLIREAMEKARMEMQAAAESDRAEYERRIVELEQKYMEAEQKGQRALSMAQQTKKGHVYVISNIGSFGEEVFKVGLTRRLEPLDRVRELGDASVPFPFDVHAMIEADDAPLLEKRLHEILADSQMNRVNPRKEFFMTSLKKIKESVEEQGYEVHWTMRAQAAEYRESLAARNTATGRNDEVRVRGSTTDIIEPHRSLNSESRQRAEL